MDLKIPALDKLLEVVASGIGAIGGPMLARWKARVMGETDQIEAQGKSRVLHINAQSHASAISLIGEAITDARKKYSGSDKLLQAHIEIHDSGEIESRLTFQEKKRTENIRSVVEMAAENLKDQEVNNHEVDHDWVARFFADIQDITSEQMQRLWAKILAGEIETPGRTSLHTLAILKNMTQRDAKLFANISRFVFCDVIFREAEKYQKNVSGFPSFGEFLKLESYNLVKVSQTVTQTLQVQDPRGFNFQVGNTLYRIAATRNENLVSIPGYALTPQGKELYGFVEATLDSTYVSALAKFISTGGHFKLEQAQIIGEKDHDNHLISSWKTVKC